MLSPNSFNSHGLFVGDIEHTCKYVLLLTAEVRYLLFGAITPETEVL